MASWQVVSAFLLAGILIDLVYRIVNFAFVLTERCEKGWVRGERPTMNRREKILHARVTIETVIASVLYFVVLPETGAVWFFLGTVAVLAVSGTVFRSLQIRKKLKKPKEV